MKLVETTLPGVIIIEPTVFRDERGYFLESFRDSTFQAAGLPYHFRQDNHSHSSTGVLRGLHYQLRHPQGKLVTCVSGSIFDVAVDIRRDSPTFGRWVGVTLDARVPRYLWIPGGFAHGFCVTSDSADVVYKCTDVFHAEDDHGIRWDDPTIGITWPDKSPLVSVKDQRYRGLDLARDDLPVMLE